MTSLITSAREALQEAQVLSSEIMSDVELSRIPLVHIALKASRLAHILNYVDAQRVFRYEASGYPTNPYGVPPEIWRLAQLAGRTYYWRDPDSKENKLVAFLESIEQLEHQIDGAKLALQSAADRDVSISSANPSQYLFTPTGNYLERKGLLDQINTASQRLGSRRALIYNYASRKYYELRYSDFAQDIFTEIRQTVDRDIGDVVPNAVQKFVSVHDNLRSEIPEV